MDNIIIEQGEISAYAELNLKDEENYTVVEECIFDKKYNSGIHSLKFNYNDQYIAAGYQNGMVRLFNVMTKNLTCELDCNPTNNPSVVQNVKWRPKIEGRTNNILMAICGGSMVEWHTPSRKMVNSLTLPDNNSIFSAEYSYDGSFYAFGCKDCSVRVYDATTRKEEVRLGDSENKKVTGHQNKVYALKFHKDNPNILLSGGWDNNVLFWDLRTGSPFRYIVGATIYGEGLDMNCCGEILTASWRKDQPLQVWDFETAEIKNTIDWNAGYGGKEKIKSSTLLYCCKFSRNFGRLIFAGGSQINSAKIFDYEGRIIASIDKLSRACLALDSSNDITTKDYQLLALGGGEGIIRVYRISNNNNN